MQIFSQEVKDGLSEKLVSSSSLAFELVPSISEVSTAEVKTENNTDSKSTDLLYFNSILVSVGWNLNDDVFDAVELIKARNTPVNKKINYMHDESDIIGHMTNSNVIDFEGNYIADIDENNPPAKFDIVVGGYLYKYWSKNELKERMVEILEKVAKKELAVSMECIFPDFDYAVITAQGEHKIIKRDESTAFLTKYLRIYGGKGSYEGFKVGRLIRNLVFTGNALVDKPANPRSLILSKDSEAFSGSIATINIFKTIAEKNMSDITKEQYDALLKRAETAEAVAKEVVQKEMDAIKTASAKIAEDNKKTLEANATLVGELAVAKEIAKANEDKAVALAEQIKILEETLAAAKEEMSKCKKEMCKSKRKAAMAEISVEDADAFVEKFAEVSDELFAELCKAMPKKTVQVETTASLKPALENAENKDTNIIVTEEANTLLATAKAWFADTLSKENKGE